MEEHFVRTSDGFVLRVFHIPPRKSGVHPAILLYHGLLDSSVTWTINNRTESLAFMLADAGYDVWLGNSRGNVFSQQHVKLKRTDKKFWEWSFSELARKDVPDVVDYIRGVTRLQKIGYVGHSQGCTQMFVNLASPESVHSKLWAFVALAPATRIKHTRARFSKFFADIGFADSLKSVGYTKFGSTEDSRLLQQGPLLLEFVPSVVAKMMVSRLKMVEKQYDMERIPDYLPFYPACTSLQNMAHWGQVVSTGKFREFEWGESKNLKLYHSKTPPEFRFSDKPFPPTLVYASRTDIFVDMVDAQWVVDRIPKSSLVLFEEIPDYDHLAFVWGIHANKDIYKPMIEHLKPLADTNRLVKSSARKHSSGFYTIFVVCWCAFRFV
eukprot:253738_1